MANVNKCLFMGNLTRDPELKFTPKGTAVCEIGLAVNHKYRGANDEVKEEVTFLTCTAWGKQAETLKQYVKKGDPIWLETRAKNDQWEDKDTGKKRTATRFVVESFQFLQRSSGGGRQYDDSQAASESGPAYRPGAAQTQTRAPASQEEDESNPFD